MALSLLVNNNSQCQYLAETEATDLLAGANIAYGSLNTTWTNYPSAVRGVRSNLLPTAAFIRKFHYGDTVYAADTGRYWIYLPDDVGGTPVPSLFLIAEGSAQPSGGGSGPDIVLVVADKAGKYAPFALSAAVYATLQAAVSAVPNSGATIVMLDDSYTLGASVAINAGTTRLRIASLSGLSGRSVGSDYAVSINGPAGSAVLTGGAALTELGFSGVRVNPDSGQAVFAAQAGLTLLLKNSSLREQGINCSGAGASVALCSMDRSYLQLLTASSSAGGQSVDIVNGSELVSVTMAAGAGSLTVRSTNSRVSSIVGNGNNVNVYASGDVEPSSVGIGDVTGCRIVSLRDLSMDPSNTISSTAVGGSVSMVNVAGSPAAVSSVGSLTYRNCYLTNPAATHGGTTLTQEGGEVLGFFVLSAAATVENTEIGAINSTSSIVSRFSNFRGSVTCTGITDDDSYMQGTINIAAGGNAEFNKSRVREQIRLGVGANLILDDASVIAAGIPSGEGAVMVQGGTVTIRNDSYVRGETASGLFFAVFGSGTLNIEGNLGGGCFIGGGMTINTTGSMGSARRIVDVTMSANTDAIAAGGVEVRDVARITSITASGWTFELYDPSNLPIGFVYTVRNSDYVSGFGFDVIPPAGVTIDGSTAPQTVGQNGVRNYMVVGQQAWETV